MKIRLSYLILALGILAAPGARADVEKPAPKPAAITGTAKTAPAPVAAKKTDDKKSADAADKKSSAAASPSDDDLSDVPIIDVDESPPLPDYPKGARMMMGKMEEWQTGEEDTLLDVTRHFDLGFVQARAANPALDAWAPPPGTKVVIPTEHILPHARQVGIVVNLAEMRLYYFKKPGAPPETFPIGIGRDGLLTPLGETEITSKIAHPSWTPTERMHKEMPWLPAVIPPGPANPLGTHALYLGWPEVRIHGSNKPWAIGRRVSSGCMRMYPEDIVKVFEEVPVGTKVTVVEQPILVAWDEGKLYIEAHPSRKQSNDLEITGAFTPKDLTDPMKKIILAAAEASATDALKPAVKDTIDWDAAAKAVHDRLGYPVLIGEAGKKKIPKPVAAASPRAHGSAHSGAEHYND